MTKSRDMIRVTSKLFGEIQVPLTDWESSLDIWDSIDKHLDINVFNYGGGVQATIFPVKDGVINTDHIIEHLTSESITITPRGEQLFSELGFTSEKG